MEGFLKTSAEENLFHLPIVLCFMLMHCFLWWMHFFNATSGTITRNYYPLQCLFSLIIILTEVIYLYMLLLHYHYHYYYYKAYLSLSLSSQIQNINKLLDLSFFSSILFICLFTVHCKFYFLKPIGRELLEFSTSMQA